jgi:hypothetical protein
MTEKGRRHAAEIDRRDFLRITTTGVLNFVATQNPAAPVSPGTDTAPLFSYNGANPAPTIRVPSGGDVRSGSEIRLA